MISIKVKELREFMKRASHIKENNILPILKYLRLECDGDIATITKSALQSFIVHQINAKFKKNIVVLLDQKILTTFIDVSQGDEITITIKGSEVVYNDQKYTARHQLIDAANFAAIKSADSAKWHDIGPDMIESIAVAKGYTQNNAVNKMWMDYVWVKDIGDGHACVFGTDGIILYFKKFEYEKMPMMVLEQHVCAIISGFKNVQYAKVDNYHFYNTGNSTYGFIELEIGYKDFKFEDIIKNYVDGISFVVPRVEFIDFCRLAIGMNPSSLQLANCYIEEAGKKQILLRYVENNHNIGSEVFVEVEKKKTNIIEFWFNPKQLQSFMDKLPYEKLIMWQMDKQTFFVATEEDKDYVGMIRGIVQGVAPVETSKKEAAKAE